MADSPESLRQLLRMKLGRQKFVVVSNREPYVHSYQRGRLRWMRPVSGVTTALDPLMRVSHGLWVANGNGPADRQASDSNGCVEVPPDQPAYRLKRVWLTREQQEKYYDGFSNAALWPLCHVAFRRPVFREEHWKAYREVNELFADRVAEEIGESRAFVFIQDYHFALLPKMLRERCPNALIAQFWHIPWPNPEVFRICPWRHEILEGMLGNDLLGFHIRYHCQNFMETVDREIEARPDQELTAIVLRGHTTRIRAFPISIDFAGTSRMAASSETDALAESLRRKFHIREKWVVGLGVDRLDYTKGIPERMAALDIFFSKYPQYQRRVVFVQVGVPSRTELEEYQSLNNEVDRAVRKLNRKYGYREWQPVIYIRDNLDQRSLVALYRMAHFLVVSSLHDGMNLVAKEFVASQVDSHGVLLLSKFAGAARELRDALLINPFSPSEVAEQIREAVEMDSIEIRRRMGRMRERVRENNIYKWAASILKKLSKLA
ncbi:MAG: alpha,alpha-trehalose-phosphate synthase (UDP-forming) [Terriglobia bacterium]